jgi:hypothetical protein
MVRSIQNDDWWNYFVQSFVPYFRLVRMLEFATRVVLFSGKFLLASIYKYIIFNLIFRVIHFSCTTIYRICTYFKDLFQTVHQIDLNKLPNHLVLCFSPEFSVETDKINHLVEYCQTLKIPKVVLYDYHGNCKHPDVECLNYVNSSKPHIFDLINKQSVLDVTKLDVHEPELMIVFGDVFSLYQFNPLAVRFSHLQHSKRMDLNFEQFKSLFYTYTQATQRYGK